MKRKLKKFAITGGILLLGIVTLFVLWASWENWTGAREWENTRAMLEAEGVALDPASLLPPPVPPEDNFCAGQPIAYLLDYDYPSIEDDSGTLVSKIRYHHPEQRENLLRLKIPDLKGSNGLPLLNGLPRWRTAAPADLEAVALALEKETGVAQPVLGWMEQFEQEIAQLDALANRPESQIPYRTKDSFLENATIARPWLGNFRQLLRFQALRAVAAMEAGDTAQARRALEGMFQIQKAFASHPTLISYMICSACLHECLSVIWQGMKDKSWSEDDLRWILSVLHDQTLLENIERAINFEMISQIGSADFLKSASYSEAKLFYLVITSDIKPSSTFATVVMATPEGVWDHNKVFACRLFFDTAIRPLREREMPDKNVVKDAMKKRTPRNFFATASWPATNLTTRNAYEADIAKYLAMAACAIELYQLDRGDYPDRLDNLVPEYLEEVPTDLFDPGSMLRYKKGSQGERYRIYSVGQNGTDDGGTAGIKRVGNFTKRRDSKVGDLVWFYERESMSKE